MAVYERHALSAAYHDLSGAVFDAIVDDMKANGFRRGQPIYRYEGKILDGWQRYRASKLANVAPVFVDYKDDDPRGFVKSMNQNRRHENLAEVGISTLKVNAWAPAGRPSKTGSNEPVSESSPMTNEEMAKEAGISVTSIKDAKAIVEKGAKATEKAAMDGDLSLREAATIARTTPKGEQAAAVREAVAAKAEPKAKPAKAKAEPKPKPPKKPKPETVAKKEYDALVKEHSALIDSYNELMENRDALAAELQAVEELRGDKHVLAAKHMHAEMMTITRSRDDAMNQSHELQKQCAYWKREAAKLGWKSPVKTK